jgi:DNA-binding transcriptional ArsR family regulator
VTIYDTMAWAKRQQTGSVGRKAVLMALAERTGEEPTCFPSQRLLAEETEQGERTVRRHLDDLETAGLITSSRRYVGADGEPLPRGKACNQYRLLVDQPAKLAAGQTGDQPAKPSRPTGQQEPTNRPNEHDQPATAMAAEEPLEDPSLEEPSLNGVAESSTGHKYTPSFLRWYPLYPRQTGKLAASRKHADAVKAVGEDVLNERTQRWADYWEAAGTEQQFIPYPATFLHQGQYEDDPPRIARTDPRSDRQKKRDAFWAEQMGDQPIDTTARPLHAIETTHREDTA